MEFYQVAYREAITKATEVDYTHKKQSGGSGQFARVKIRFEPKEDAEGLEFVDEIKGGVVPREYIPGVAKGIASGMSLPFHSTIALRFQLIVQPT